MTCDRCGDEIRHRNGSMLWCSCGRYVAVNSGVFREEEG